MCMCALYIIHRTSHILHSTLFSSIEMEERRQLARPEMMMKRQVARDYLRSPAKFFSFFVGYRADWH